jgi:hypothetical protein
MKKSITNIIVRAWWLLVSTTDTWDEIATEDVSKNELRKHYVFPWIAFCVLTVAVFEGLYAKANGLEVGFLNALIAIISLVGGYFLSNSVCFWYLRKHQPEQYTLVDCEKIVSYSFTTIFILEIITTVFPSLFFLQILSIYTAYLVWEGSRAVLKMNEEERGNIVLVFTLAIVFIPVLISRIIHLMLPNA